jgi:dihydrofolate reductase
MWRSHISRRGLGRDQGLWRAGPVAVWSPPDGLPAARVGGIPLPHGATRPSNAFGWALPSMPVDEPSPAGAGAEWLATTMARIGAVVGGRWTYEAARRWGDENPWGLPFFIVTHRPEEQPEGDAFTFVSGVEAAVERARQAAGEKDVNVMGGADVIRQALAAGLVDELTIIIAPVVLGGGKRLFEGFTRSLDLEHLGVRQCRYATFVHYRVKAP